MVPDTVKDDIQAIRDELTGGTIDVNIVSGGSGGGSVTGIGHGVTTVTTAGTDVALASSTTCQRVIIQAQTDNTSVIAVGSSGVDATVATGSGTLLYPGDTFELDFSIH